MKKQTKKINFREQPYKGVFTEIAKECGSTPSGVRQAANMGNPRIVQLVNGKIEERLNIIKKAKTLGVL